MRRGQPFAAGAVLSLCSIKPHFFLLLPVFLLSRYFSESTAERNPNARRELRSFGFGFMAAGGILLAASFAAGGIAWPVRYLELLARHPDPQVDHMPTLRGAFAHWPAGWPLKWSLILFTAGAVWVAARRLSFDSGFGLVLIAGLLISPHAYAHDCALLLPGCAALYEECHGWLREGWLRPVISALQVPVLFVLVIVSPAGAAVISVLLLMLIGGIAWELRPDAFRTAPRQNLAPAVLVK
jgi:hypothetical protein